jgi:predicted nucleotidyltransferase
MHVIRRFARQVAEPFQPDKIILFGSHAYGTPHADSDVDILGSCRAGTNWTRVKISLAVDPPFPLDIIVRKPHNLQWRLEEGESFHTEIVTKGKVLYEKKHTRVSAKSRGRLRRHPQTRPRQRTRP